MNRFLIILLLFATTSAYAQFPCISEQITNLTQGGEVSQSSTYQNSIPEISIDGKNEGDWATGKSSRTLSEENAWWEIDLGDTYAIESVNVWYPRDIYPTGFSDYYILYSPYPFSSTDLATELASPIVDYLHVASSLPSGTSLPLAYESARYIRIQNAGNGVLAFLEIDVPGSSKEVCGNGCDDDRDGLTDCEDSDCAPRLFNVTSVDPSCPICPDGRISIQAFGENIHYSIDGGVTYQPACYDTYLCHIDGLVEGDYDVFIRNDNECSVAWPGNPIQLRGPVGTPLGDCENGGFEEGTWSNWNGLVSTANNEEVEVRYHSDRHFIRSTGFDPIVPELVIPFSGAYAAQLNAPIGSSWQIGARYCFTVDDSNKDFVFNYAMVLQDPDAVEGGQAHREDEKPFFSYEMYYTDPAGDKQIVPGGSFIVRADENNKFFKPVEHDTYKGVVYRGWTCVFIDLNDFVGMDLCIDFMAADCSLGEHFGYAYIDGLCTSEYEPVLDFNANSIYCENQKVEIDATGSYGFDQYTWEVCVLDDNGEPVFCAEENVIDFEIDLFDASKFITENGGSFECGMSIKVKLTVENNCSEPMSMEKIIEYVCAEHEISYKDIFICATTANIDVPIEGSNNCAGCTYTWEPPLGLNSSSAEFPTILGSINGFALQQNYVVTAVPDEGCEYRDTVHVYFLPEVEFSYRDDLSYCGRTVIVDLIFNQPVDNDWLLLEFENVTTGQILTGELQGDETISDRFQYELLMEPTSNIEIEVRVSWNVSSAENTIVELNEDCISSTRYQLERNTLFYGSTTENMAMPNAFIPDGLPPDNTFSPVVLPGAEDGSNVYWARMQVYNRWGQKVHDMSASSTINPAPDPGYNTPLDMESIAWDGTQNGLPAASDVYLYIVWFANCSYPDEEENRKQDCCRFTGNVTLIR